MEKSGNNKVNVRLQAVKALRQILSDGGYANVVIQQYIGAVGFSEVDRRFFTELVYGVIRRKNYLDAIIQKLTNKVPEKLSPWVLYILRLGLYQMIYMDKVPSSAAVDESVKLAKKLVRGLDKFVNAVLRNYLRNQENLSMEDLADSEEEKLSLIYNQPQWLINFWSELYTKDQVADLCAYFNETPQLNGRVNTIKTDIDSCHKRLTDMGVNFEVSDLFKEGIIITGHTGDLRKADWVQDGSVAFLDEGSMAIAYALDPQKGDKVLDCCAAPGSKSTLLAALMQNEGRITACDIHPHKIELLKEGSNRLGATIIDSVLRDATVGEPREEAYYDRVLADVPCSGLGILQNRPDMRWRKNASDLEVFPPLQKKILSVAAKAVKKGGILVYSTCTLNILENEGVVQNFLEDHPEFILEDVSPYIPFDVEGPMVTLTPFIHHTNGFFIARLRRS